MTERSNRSRSRVIGVPLPSAMRTAFADYCAGQLVEAAW